MPSNFKKVISRWLSGESACSAGDMGSIPESGKLPGQRNGNPLQNSYLEKSHGQRILASCALHGGCKSQTLQLNNKVFVDTSHYVCYIVESLGLVVFFFFLRILEKKFWHAVVTCG